MAQSYSTPPHNATQPVQVNQESTGSNAGWIVMTPADVIDTIGATLGHTCLAVYIVIDRHTNKNRQSTVTEERIAEALKLTVRWVRDAIRKLELAKWIETHPQRNRFNMITSNTYFIPNHWCGSQSVLAPEEKVHSSSGAHSALVDKLNTNQIQQVSAFDSRTTTRPPVRPSENFTRFWGRYEHRWGSNRETCYAMWVEYGIDDDPELFASVMNGLGLWLNSISWKREGGRNIHKAETWLRNRLWEMVPAGSVPDV